MEKRNAIFFACNQRFLFTLAVALLSLKKNSPKALENSDVLVFYQGFNEQDKALLNKILPCKFFEYKFAVETNFDHINFKHFSQLTFARYEIFDMLDTYKKVLYIDVDVMIGGELNYIFENYGDKTGVAMCEDTQKGLTLITKNFVNPMPQYDMTLPCYNAGVTLFCDNIKDRQHLKMWCYERTAEWLDNLVCPDQGVVNVMFQEFGITVEVLPDICNCLPSNPKYLDKRRKDILIYHCAGGGVRFWTYTWNAPWQKFYKEYLELGGAPHPDKEHAWLKFIKKYNLQRFRFFDRSPDPQMHPARFLKYLLIYPFKYAFRKY
ncbi:Glycosyl transferase family [Elusimicrobium minutum Pei191]|uniref:Glycosyl transferase family n=1 Tax=Elusimicrobium minutum (strain Pei191) TaxID=445932 RepID=B2KBT4_ELUMP|nr:glycosyltransferase [Elusimicrobium minutum]ACC97838.1 Glycosyl transferase family [Elusimicrobium minutum Pei191]